MNKNIQKGVILVNTFSRDASLRKCLNSIKIANLEFGLPLVIVVQVGFPLVASVLKEFSSEIIEIVEVDGNNRSALENINHNRYLGYKIAFEGHGADWVLAVEEDVLISPDSISFCSQLVEKNFRKPFFRGINLGSREPYSRELSKTYSKLRYGLHGQAAVLTRKTWKNLNHSSICKKFSTHGFDSLIEFKLKTGFMITPNNSRSLDTGWDGTHMPGDSNDPYFTDMQMSFMGNHSLETGEFVEFSMLHRWRSDIEIYKLSRTPRFILHTKWNLMKHEIKTRLRRLI